MGYASPSVGYVGYVPSNTTLYIDSTQNGITSTSWMDLWTGRFISDCRIYSKIRFKCDIQNAGAADCYVRLYNTITGETYASFTQAPDGLNWHSHSGDFTISQNARGQELLIQGYYDPGGGGAVKNVEIAGAISPIIFH